MSDLSGTSIRGYELHKQVGAGGFGAVYKASQPIIGRDVAIKVILPELANQTEFIRRFESEARLVARLEHPNIIPLYDYWRDPSGAYLVMRWLQGGSLRNLLDARKVLPPEEVSQLLDQLAAALMVAHRGGVIHRDLKPENVLLDEDENVYLADFGIAKDTTNRDDAEANVMVGSPAYLSPEQIRAEPVSPQTDIYSLGIVLYELLTGKRPFPGDVTSTQLIFNQLHDPLPPLHENSPHLPSQLDSVLQRATAKNPVERYTDTRSLASDFRRIVREMGAPTPGTVEVDLLSGGDILGDFEPGGGLITISLEPENPYKGLRAFQEADSADFFGRDALIEQLIGRLQEDDTNRRFLAVVGPSGSGKSSVVKAGVIPSLRRGALPGSEHWFYAEMTPGSTPFQELEAALLSVATQPIAVGTLAKQLANGEMDLARVMELLLPADPSLNVVLVIDQFEEVFTQAENEAVTKQFLSVLMNGLDAPNSRLRLIVTLRADYYDRPLLHPAFGNLMRLRTEVVLPLSPAELALAVSGPAERVGLRLEPGLVETIVADVGEQPGALPLLQYALTELYERRRGSLLLLDAYRESGGALGALARRADELYLGLDADRQKAVRQVFLRLVTLGEGAEDTRRRARRTEFINTGNDTNLTAVLDTYSKYRLLTFDVDPETRVPTVEVAHEALIRTWKRLREWLDDDRELVRTQRRLSAAASEWKNAKQDTSFLATGSRLAQYEALLHTDTIALTQDEITFVKASLAERDRAAAEEARRKAHELELARQAAKSAEDAAKNAQTAAAAQRTAANRLRYLAAFMAVAFVVAVLLSIFALTEQNRAAANEKVAIANAATATIAQGQALNNEGTAVSNALTATVAQGAAIFNAATATVARGQAQNNAATAQANFIRSEALRLAADVQVNFQQNGDPQLLSLLALYSLRTQVTAPSINAVALASTVNLPIRQSAQMNSLIFDVVYSADGKSLYAADGSHLKLIDVLTDNVLYDVKPSTDTIRSIALSRGGSFLIVGTLDGAVKRLNAADLQPVKDLLTSADSINQVALSPDEKILAVSAGDQLLLIDPVTGNALTEPIKHPSPVSEVAFAPDGNSIVVGCADSKAYIWDMKGQKLHELVGHTEPVLSVSYRADGALIMTSGRDRTIRLWDAATGQVVNTLTGHMDEVVKAVFSPDKKHIATSSADRTVRVYDIETFPTGTIYSLRAVLTGYPGSVYALAWAPDGKSLVAGGELGALRYWDVNDQASLRVYRGVAQTIGSVTLTKDGKQALLSTYGGYAYLRDTSTGLLLNFFGDSGTVAAAISPDGHLIALGGSDGAITLIELNADRTQKSARTFSGHTDLITSINFSTDNGSLVTASNDGTARVWRVADAQSVVLKGHTSRVLNAVFSPDGKSVLTGSDDNTARLWESASGKSIRILIGFDGSVDGTAFSPDGKQVAAASEEGTNVFDAESGKELWKVSYPQGKHPNAVAFSPDGKRLAAGGTDRDLNVYDAASGALLYTYSGHTDWIQSVVFSPDGKYILSAGYDKSLHVWDADYKDSIKFICKRLTRDLSDEEREQYGLDEVAPDVCEKFGTGLSSRVATLTPTPTPG